MKRAAAILALLAAAAGLAWWATDSYNAAVQRADQADTTAAALRKQLDNANVATVTVTQYVDRERVIRLKGDTIIKEVPRYVPVQADAACVVPRGFVRLHDVAATGTVPNPDTGDADVAPAGVALSTVAGTVAANYTDCHVDAARLSSLQQTLRDQGMTIIGEPTTP